MAQDHNEDFIAVPMGLVALTWIRLFKPLLKADLPQNPSNVGLERLGFAKAAFRRLAEVSHLDLRVGIAFSGDVGAALHRSLQDATQTIARMPASHMTYPNGGPILPITRGDRRSPPPRLLLDPAYLWSFGEMLVPRHLWTALQRFDVWIEPALIAEWSRLIKFYAGRQGRTVDDGRMAAAMAWGEPSREVWLARERALRLAESGQLACVWSGQALTDRSLDLDHCFPWSAWPCGDLWNLMPAHRAVNQYEKRARLPTDRLLRSAGSRIMEWWELAYTSCNLVVGEQFWLEANATLPSLGTGSASLTDVFDAVSLQRMKLRHDQQVPEWAGERYLRGS